MHYDPIKEHRIWHMVRRRLQTGEYEIVYGDWGAVIVKFRTKFAHGVTFDLMQWGEETKVLHAEIYSGFWKAFLRCGGDRVVKEDIPIDIASHVAEIVRVDATARKDQARRHRNNEIIVSMDNALK